MFSKQLESVYERYELAEIAFEMLLERLINDPSAIFVDLQNGNYQKETERLL
jgi:hypothetical protein